MEKQEEAIKDRECLNCTKLFKCKGHPVGTKSCVNFEDRKGEQKDVEN